MINKIEFSILDFIQDVFSCDFLDVFMSNITKLADHGIVPILLAVILLIITKTRRIGLSMGISFICGGVIGNLILKNVVQRMRPYQLNEAFQLIIPPLSDYSFPSGHTLIAFETAVVLMIMLKGRTKPIAFFSLALAFIIAFSRLYLYVHFPSDVLIGMILGTFFAFVGVKTSDYIYKVFDRKKNLALTEDE